MTDATTMLDTNIVSHLLRHPGGPVRRHLLGMEGQICVSLVTACELRFGARKLNSPRLDRQITEILSVIPPIEIGLETIAPYAATRDHLERAGQPIGPNDLLIAAHALALDLTLVTGNIREFSRVPGLRVENWLD